MDLEEYIAEQRTYHLRKMMKIRYVGFDVTKDASITLDDYELMAKRTVEYENLPKDMADKVLEEMVVLVGCGKPGDKISVQEATKYAHKQLLILPEDKWRPKINEMIARRIVSHCRHQW